MARRVKKRSLLDDPRYPAFVERYHADPLRFAVEVTGFEPSLDQMHLFQGIVAPKAQVSVVSGTGCFAKGTMMMRANGEAVAVEDIRVGDRLMGPDGKSVRNVLELKRGREPMYRFTYRDGTTHVFNESHILTLAPGARFIGRGKTDIVNVTVRDWLKWPKTSKNRYYAYRTPVDVFERPKEPMPVPPYILGLWLGDGSTHKPQITTMDTEVDQAFAGYLRSIGCIVTRSENSVKSWTVQGARVKGTKQANPFTAALRVAGVFENKHVPVAYKYASRADRLQLLAGLIDTDGFRDGTGYVFTQKSESIARDVCWIARSVGCAATLKSVRKTCVNTGALGVYWSVYISRNADVIPVRVERRKIPVGRKQRGNLIFSIRSVECLGEGDYYGFALDGDHRFLADDFTVLHNTGKTASFARIALWHLLCFPMALHEDSDKIEIGSNTYIGAPNLQQVADGVWKEMTDARIQISDGPHAWINDYYDITKTKVVVKGFDTQWFINQIALQKGQSVGVAGKHRYWQLIIIDEAAGVPDEHYNVINGTQTQPGNRTLLASQGVRNAGFFYDTHHLLAKENGGSWLNLCFSSERAPWVSKEWIAERLLETGGRNSVEYRIRVLGEFAQSTTNMLLSRTDIDIALQGKEIIGADESYGYLVLTDVGAGEYRDSSVIWIAKVIGAGDFGEDARRVEFIELPVNDNSIDPVDLAGRIIDAAAARPNASTYVDAGGVGITVLKLIERSNGIATGLNWGKPCFRKEYKERFYNLRACAMVRFRDAIRQGRVSIRADLSQRTRQQIIDEATRLPYHFSEAGGLKYVMEKKEEMKKQSIKSPDLIDAMSFAFIEGITYMPAGENLGVRIDGGAAALRKAEALFSD